ncbi:hypothetical protein [Sphingomonas sp. VNH70]|uniref:hypothetical protein n=1 Tax=Sphingomonas silueang TaxID=3156617 RepID=UPI0032B32593
MLLTAMVAVLLPAVTVERREVTLGDLVRRADGGRIAGRAAGLVVLRLAAGRQVTRLDAATVRALVRRRQPSLAVRGAGSVAITLHAPVVGAQGCWTARRTLAAGEVVTTGDVVSASCDGAPVDAIGHDGGDRAARARTALAAGAPLGRFVPAPRDRVAAGTALTLRAAYGPVAVERVVTTLQPARAGRRVFVRDAGGQVLSAPLALAEDAR